MFLRSTHAGTARALTLIGSGWLLAGCVVGPNYRGPDQVAPLAAQATAFHRTPNSGVAAAPAVAVWWGSLNDAQLSALIATAIKNSPDIKVAEARLRQARAGLKLSKANALPNGTGSALALRTRSPDTTSLLGATGLGGSSANSSSSSNADSTTGSQGRGPVQLYDVGFDATWEVDLFGANKRSIEAASAQAEASTANLDDAHVSLAAEVAQTYVGLRDQQLRYTLIRQSADLQQKMLDLSLQRRTRGAASDADIAQLRTQLESTQATLIPIDEQLSESLDALAVLCGQEPGTLDKQLKNAAALPVLPATVTVGKPADMLRQRPDIRAAERNLAAASAQIGVKTAARFPTLTLVGDLGFAGTSARELLTKENFTWLGLPYLSWNFLDFGRKKAGVEQAEGAMDEANAQYKGAVLRALQDAESSLSRYGHQRDNLASLERVQALTQRNVAYAEQRYQVGAASLIDRYDSQRSGLTAQQNVIAGTAELLKDFIALQKSLGLGWQTPSTAPDNS
jgi:NodT family efflux transporter outer membrane factor (OMF) lipoprotein